MIPDAETCWQAVTARDARFDETFVYAVRSTGVYCRPACPSRRPRRQHVVFFSVPEEAERAGFRPCGRCRPRAESPHAVLVKRLCRYIAEHLEERVTLKALGKEAGMSPYHVQRLFKRLMGVTPRQYEEGLRIRSVKASLRRGGNVTHALYEAGYGSSSRLYERSNARLGMTPGTYRRGGENMRIHYTIVDSALGRLLVAATERGVCAVSMGDSDRPLVAALSEEYPKAEIRSDANSLGRWVNAIVKHLDGRGRELDLPLDVKATAFQCRVWEQLRAIPYGSTRSYSEVARALGRPTATRAVARACATNPVSVVVPCHRVVREDGGLGGYRWGLNRKKALLEQERASVQEKG